ncbi:aldehyde oxidase GLOX1-like [Arachis stenosperma]|uniref:aldehyde oxidase GLOX1-like n=1 Tax=Arachis stenosperma TaxID=217475 RepID=UPI0025AD6DB7|nr:aldehyde oxidase GLOX1-like [Arachis stenosperma]
MGTGSISVVILLVLVGGATALSGGGEWQLLQKSIGIVGMHMQLLQNDRIVIYDRTDFGLSNLSLPNNRCRHNQREMVVTIDCTAHSVEYDVVSNTFRPLFVQTDVWCSSGSVSPNGTLVQTGGFNDGDRAVRTFSPCSPNATCDWIEFPGQLSVRRWYATNQKLPDGGQIVIGGRRQFNYEFYPNNDLLATQHIHSLPFLVQTNDIGAENNLYPFVFLNVDGNLFIFANNKSILFNYAKNVVVKTYPDIPNGDPRCYPSTGSAVMLPLKMLQGNNSYVEAEVLVCGGAPENSFKYARAGRFFGALNTCGRIKITDPNPKWVMETMPKGRVMSDMIMLPNGNVLIINGAGSGTAGWGYARDPILNPFLYKTDNPIGSRFEVQNPTTIPRMYHSTAILVRDGRVIVAGSNPNKYYNFTNVLFSTDLSVEAFSPSYLEPAFDHLRPRIMSQFQDQLIYGQMLRVQFQVEAMLAQDLVYVTMLAPPFNTHSFSMNQRLLVLEKINVTKVFGASTYEIEVTTPKSPILAPPGFYIIFVVHQQIPSEGIWVQIL